MGMDAETTRVAAVSAASRWSGAGHEQFALSSRCPRTVVMASSARRSSERHEASHAAMAGNAVASAAASHASGFPSWWNSVATQVGRSDQRRHGSTTITGAPAPAASDT